MTLGVTKRDRVALRADKWWRSIYLKQMQMMDRGQVRERSEPIEIIDKCVPVVSYCSTPRATDYHQATDGRSVTNITTTNGD